MHAHNLEITMNLRAAERERQAANASGPEALKHAIAAAELYMQAAKEAATPADRARPSRKCKDMLDLAEKLKHISSNPDPPGPRSTRELTTPEKITILKSSKLHGDVFPPWEGAPNPGVFTNMGDGLYTDSFLYTFSPAQRAHLNGWKRPSEELSAGDGSAALGRDPAELMAASAEADLVQDLLTDCSVVASLSAAMPLLRPQKDSLLGSLMYPFDHRSSMPAISPNGKYIFRMYFNGCARRVTIDDRLPSSTSSRALLMVDQQNPDLVWPALMEKAYLKVRGGYDFPGSNSSTDLHVLTGWVPEQLFFQDEDFDADVTWDMVKRAHDAGNLLVTLGTAYLPPEEEDTLGLVSKHDYAVLGMSAEAGVRRMLVKNPWRDSVVWTGVGSSASTDVITSRPNLPTNLKAAPRGGNIGVFWMPFEDVVQNFAFLYLNWKPALFTHRQDHHFTWEPPLATVASALSHNPQYSVRSPTPEPIWILLNRHWQDGELEILRKGQRQDDRGHGNGSGSAGGGGGGGSSASAVPCKTIGFMSLSVYTSSPPGSRVSLPDRTPLVRNAFVDSSDTLLRIERPEPDTTYTVVVAQADLPLPKYSFTLSFLSTAPLHVGPATEPLQHTIEMTGAWTRRTAGGNTDSPTYHINPQFSVTVPPSSPGGAHVHLLLTTDSGDLPVHVALLHSDGGRRITGPANRRRDVLASSPEYRRGAAAAATPAAAPVPPGTYTAVVSTFEAGQLARFALRVSSSAALAVAALAADGAGRLRSTAPPLPLAACGPAAAMTTTSRAPVTLARLTRLGAVARCAAAAAAGAVVRVSVELGTGPARAVLAAAAEDGGDALAGLRTGDVDVEPRAARLAGGLWLVVEHRPLVAGPSPDRAGIAGRAVVVELLSDVPLRLGEWEKVDG